MSIAKIYKRWQIWVILWLIITAVTLCRIDTIPVVSGENPPTIEFNNTRAQLYVMGPYTLEELKLEYKRGNKNYYIWQLDPGSLSRAFGVSITYGIVPNGFRQVYPANGKSPEPLIEGKIYSVVAPSADTADVKSALFMIDNGRAVVVHPSQITDK